MIELNLSADDAEEELIKSYLQENASEILADKINNGVKIVKDGKTILSKKNLKGFQSFATEEARKRSKKGARSACVHDSTVFGWAIHYFEEDSIEGTLYNEDGTEYKPQKPKVPVKSAVAIKSPPKSQLSLFDLMQPDKPEDKNVTDEQNENDEEYEQTDNVVKRELPAESVKVQQPERIQTEPHKPTPLPFYQRYTELKEKYPQRVIVYRLGDFYEIFGEDAVNIARDFDLTLTSRDCGLSKRIPVIGFSYYAADNYFGEIIERGYKLAVVEDLDAPRLLEKQETEQDNLDAIDPETGEVLTETEMRLFDGDVKEPQVITPDIEGKTKAIVPTAFDAEALQSFERILGKIYVLR